MEVGNVLISGSKGKIGGHG